MAYDPNQTFSPAGQMVMGIGGGLTQILGAYLGAKVDADKRRREFESNKRIIRANNPNMSDEDLNYYAAATEKQMPQLIEGLRGQSFRDVLQGPQQQQALAEAQQQGQFPQIAAQQDQQAALEEAMQQNQVPSSTQRLQQTNEILSQLDPNLAQKVSDSLDKKYIANEARDIGALKNRLMNATGLTSDQQLKIQDILMKKEQNLQKVILDDKKLQEKRALEAEKTAIEQEKLNIAREGLNVKKMNAKNATDKLKFEREEKIYDRFEKAYDPIVAEKDGLLENLSLLEQTKKLNEDPNVSFGSDAWNTFTGFLENKLGLKVNKYRTDAAQYLNKVNSFLFSNISKNMSNAAATTIKEATKGLPGLDQSYYTRAIVTEGMLASTRLKLKQIELAEKMLRKNKNKPIENFKYKLEEKMDPYYKKYLKTMRNIRKKVYGNKSLVKKQTNQSRGMYGAIGGALTGGAGGALASALAGGAIGGVPGAVIGGVGGLLSGALGAGVGGVAGEQVVKGIWATDDYMKDIDRRAWDTLNMSDEEKRLRMLDTM
jgi:hypothetical protein